MNAQGERLTSDPTDAEHFVLENSSKSGTLDMVINTGWFHNELARQSAGRNIPVFGSSANISLTGTKYRLNDVDEDVLQAADITVDYGLATYATDQGLSSTIIDFRDFSVVRIGIVFDQLVGIFKDEFGVILKT